MATACVVALLGASLVGLAAATDENKSNASNAYTLKPEAKEDQIAFVNEAKDFVLGNAHQARGSDFEGIAGGSQGIFGCHVHVVAVVSGAVRSQRAGLADHVGIPPIVVRHAGAGDGPGAGGD